MFGLACLVGAPAINPVPRKMIPKLASVARDNCYDGGLKVTTSVPEGVEIAKKLSIHA